MYHIGCVIIMLVYFWRGKGREGRDVGKEEKGCGEGRGGIWEGREGMKGYAGREERG